MDVQQIKMIENVFSLLANHCGERGDNEGAVETLARIIRERDEAREVLSENVPGGVYEE